MTDELRRSAEHLIAALERFGWQRCGGRANSYVRLRRPDALWRDGVSLVVPLDASAGDFAELMQAAVSELQLTADRGELARQVLTEYEVLEEGNSDDLC